MKEKPTFRKKPEAIIQRKIVNMLVLKGWYCMETHGNMYQWGFPDVFATHTRFGARWIEVKNPLNYSFTAAQLECFPKLCAYGSPVWILTAATPEEYNKLFAPFNWFMYLL